MSAMSRPDMRAYFRARIEYHVHGMLAHQAYRPAGVRHIKGDVTDSNITMVMQDGTEYHWSGGQYASRKVFGCYSPLMPKVVN